jgi:hypothetical protein
MCPLRVKSRHMRCKQAMSALHPITTAKAKFRNRPCPLYPRKRTCAVQLGMSAMGQKRTFPSFRSMSVYPQSALGQWRTSRHCVALAGSMLLSWDNFDFSTITRCRECEIIANINYDPAILAQPPNSSNRAFSRWSKPQARTLSTYPQSRQAVSFSAELTDHSAALYVPLFISFPITLSSAAGASGRSEQRASTCVFGRQCSTRACFSAASIRAALTVLLAFIVWWSFIVGHVMNDIRGFGS